MHVKKLAVMLIALTVVASGCGQAHRELRPDNAEPDYGIQLHSSNEPLIEPEANVQYDNPPPEPKPEPEAARSKKQVKAKGIYVSAPIAASPARLEKLIHLLNRTELNTMVIDIKNDWGAVTYESDAQKSLSPQAERRTLVKDMAGLVKKLKSHNIYLIGRVVAFKDPWLARSRPDLAMTSKAGGIWKDGGGTAWVDPYIEQVRAYNIDIAKEAAQLGFDEVQFDYVRFPDNGTKVDRQVAFKNQDGVSKADLIKQFAHDASAALSPLGVNVSADVFGLTTTVDDDMGIGQAWDKLADEVDYMSPMVYPSHYSKGMYGFQNPDMHPYGVVNRALRDALNKQTSAGSASGADTQIRPWLQCFTASWLKPHMRYSAQHVQEQIRAVSELGIEQYLLWNPRCQYEAYVAR